MASPLEKLIGVTFQDQRLLQSAFVHPSFLHEHPERAEGLSSNARLEFLGDAVLGLISAAWLYEHFPALSEGELTNLRADMVKTTTLAEFARSLDLGEHIRISRGEDTPSARNRAALLADLFEALLAAIYLDQGLEAARNFVLPFFSQRIAAIQSGQVEADYRTRLQVEMQARFAQTPIYQTIAVGGPDHARIFTVEVLMGTQSLGTGSGPSKQAAAREAARMALATLKTTQAAP